MRRPSRRHLLPGGAAFAAALTIALLGLNAGAEEPSPAASTRPGHPAARTVALQVLGVNDFHGNLEPPARGVGGAAWLAAHLERAERHAPGRTITVHAGDMVGVSPLISSHDGDRPTIEALNRMPFDVGAVGNHEFDEGGAALLALLRGSRFPWLAANVIDPVTNRPLLTPWKVIERGGVRVGFIGVTTDDTPTWLLPRFKHEYRYRDISDTVNRCVADLRARGVEAIVVLAHSGAVQRGASATGEIVDETAEMDDAVDLVVGGHTHTPLNVDVDGKLLVQSAPYGEGFERVSLRVDRRTGDVVAKSARLERTGHAGLRPNPAVARLVAADARRIAPLGGRLVGRLRRTLGTRALNQTAAGAQRELAGADVAFVNGGDTRRPSLAAGPVTFAEAHAVQAYEHPVVRMTMRGSDVLAAWRGRGPVDLYASGLAGVRPEGTYSVAVNGVLAAAPRFPAFRRGGARRVAGTDLDAFVSWLERHAPLGRTAGRRFTPRG